MYRPLLSLKSIQSARSTQSNRQMDRKCSRPADDEEDGDVLVIGNEICALSHIEHDSDARPHHGSKFNLILQHPPPRHSSPPSRLSQSVCDAIVAPPHRRAISTRSLSNFSSEPFTKRPHSTDEISCPDSCTLQKPLRFCQTGAPTTTAAYVTDSSRMLVIQERLLEAMQARPRVGQRQGRDQYCTSICNGQDGGYRHRFADARDQGQDRRTSSRGW
ncbi:hypothetical protein BKA70DRAFT_731535 [Coprinopsis sp. MPI-PUGE-AT-0042]|nr:hypothetical protein BKA70DRAFT_731535 [Coprinopsis sp. MPI-PUGE-AT-0042]